jgi:hypothetical protein
VVLAGESGEECGGVWEFWGESQVAAFGGLGLVDMWSNGGDGLEGVTDGRPPRTWFGGPLNIQEFVEREF